MTSTAAQALRIHGVDDLRIDPVELPAPARSDAVVQVEYGGICGSDIHYWREGAVGASVLRAPMILGHEVVATVLRAAADGRGPEVGTAVAVHPAQTCGQCAWCTTGRHHLCVSCRYLGSAAQWPHTDGGFVTQLNVPVERLLPLPDGLEIRRGALAEPTAIAWHAIERASAVGAELDGARVFVVGAGPIGLLVAAVARHRGAASITASDVRPRPLAVARQMGVDHTVLASDVPAGDTEPQADIVFESSGSPSGFVTAVRSVRRGGTVVAVGQLPQSDQQVPAWRIVTNELTVTGSLRMHTELDSVLGFLAGAGAAVDPVISHVYSLAEAREAFEVAADADVSSKVLLRF